MSSPNVKCDRCWKVGDATMAGCSHASCGGIFVDWSKAAEVVDYEQVEREDSHSAPLSNVTKIVMS